MINKRFLYFSTAAAFENVKSEIQNFSIAFVDQPAVAQVGEVGDQDYVAPIAAEQFVYTHGKKFQTSFDPSTLQAAIDTLNGSDSTNGSVKKTIKDVINGILVDGTSEGKAITKIERNSTTGALTATLGGVSATNISVADSAGVFTATNVEAALKELYDAIQDLDYTIPAGNHTDGKAVTAVSQSNGKISVTEGNVKSEFVTYTPQVVTPASGDDPAVYDTTKTDIQEATKEIYGQIRNLTASSALTLVDASDVAATTVKADGTTYKLKQGSSVVAQFNIMKETFLDTASSGLVWFKSAPAEFAPTGTTTGESSQATYATWTDAEKKAAKAYLKLVMRTDADGDSGQTGDTTANAYLPASALIDVYTGSVAADGVITVSVSDANVITATIGDNTIAWGKLTSAAQHKIESFKTTITEVAQTNPATKHITVTKTAGNESTGVGDNYVIAENDIASASYVGTLPASGFDATTVVGYAAEVASDEADEAEAAAKSYADDITVNGQSQSSQAITIEADDINIQSGYAKAQTAADIAAADSISTAFGKVEKKIDSINSDLTDNIRWEQGTKNSSKVTGAVQTKGSNSKAYGVNSVAAGTAVTANNEGEAAFGLYNASATGETDAAKTVFSVGIGASAVAPKNAIEVRKDGTINIYKSVSDVSATSLQSILAELDWYEA